LKNVRLRHVNGKEMRISSVLIFRKDNFNLDHTIYLQSQPQTNSSVSVIRSSSTSFIFISAVSKTEATPCYTSCNLDDHARSIFLLIFQSPLPDRYQQDPRGHSPVDASILSTLVTYLSQSSDRIPLVFGMTNHSQNRWKCRKRKDSQRPCDQLADRSSQPDRTSSDSPRPLASLPA